MEPLPVEEVGKKANKRRRSSQGTDGTEKRAKRQKKPFNREEWESQRNSRQATASNLTGRSAIQLNDLFVTFYKAQNIVSEEDWELFTSFLDKELPTTFRVSTRSNFTRVLQQVLETQFLSSSSLSLLTLPDGTEIPVEPPRELDWYSPEGLAWHYTINRKALRKTPALKHFKKILAEEQEVGHLTRQEGVSMIPPLLLGIEPHHKVLDMCAAPGSKTGQLLELLHEGLGRSEIPTNDVDVRRCYMLTRHVQHAKSPCNMVTNYPAQAFPDIFLEESVPLKFDRVLCDVPCSGDGTIRKAPNISKTWAPKGAMSLHGLQVAIAERGLQLLEVGGVMVYSTCALNPIEDEAVVATLLERHGDAVSIVDAHNILPTLKRNPGLTTWKVFGGNGKEIPTPEDIPPKLNGLIQKTMFPPSDSNISESLKRCMRFLPHLQDTGGFFITVIKKNKVIESTGIAFDRVTETPDDEEHQESGRKKSKGGRGYPKEFSEDSFVPISQEVLPSYDSIKQYYGFHSEAANASNLMTRSSKTTKLYLYNSLLRKILITNHNLKAKDGSYEELRVINGGIRLLTNESGKNRKLNFECPWRISVEGLPFLLPHLTKRTVTVNLLDFALVLASKEPVMFSHFADTTVGATLKDMEVGSLIMKVKAFDEKELEEFKATLDKNKNSENQLLKELCTAVDWDYFNCMCGLSQLAFMAWKGTTSVILHLTKLELASVQNLLLTSDYSYHTTFLPKVPFVATQKIFGQESCNKETQ